MSPLEIPPFRTVVDPSVAARYRKEGWWGDSTVAEIIEVRAESDPQGLAFMTPDQNLSWAQYRDDSNRLAWTLIQAGLEPGERVAMLLDDGATPHVVMVANEKAGLITVGIGARAGEQEIGHLIGKSGAVALISHERHRQIDQDELFGRLAAAAPQLRLHVVVPVFEADHAGAIRVNGVVPTVEPARLEVTTRRMGPDDLYMINSTSGTTGLPKCVMHTQNSKFYMADQAREVGRLGGDEVVLGAAPIPFGFGIFTTHFLPLVLGARAVVSARFDADLMLELIERHGVTVLVCVSTQFKMMLNSPQFAQRDLSSLRVMFTGGEMIPRAAAGEFEGRTGSKVLNFYGSNESGVATGTRVDDTTERRLTTGGSYLLGTEVRLFEDGRDVTDTGRGQPGSRGPATCVGYWDDPDANDELFTDDGFMLHADIVTIDGDGYLVVVGRKSDLIIRGGKNISAAVIEDEVLMHPDVALAAAVAMPDPLFGERVCIYVELRAGATLDLAQLSDFLGSRGVSRELFPEFLVVLDEIPRSSGSKVAKGDLRADAARRAAQASR